MKKIYVLSLSLLASGYMMAQSNNNTPGVEKKISETPVLNNEDRPNIEMEDRAGGDIIWSNDFSNAGDWTATGPSGDYTVNGWSIGSSCNAWYFPSGDMGTTGDFARFVNGDPTASPSTAIESGPFTLELNTPIDLTGVPGPRVEFEQYGARFVTLQAIEVSTDGGTTWTQVGNNDDIDALTSTGGSVYDKPMTRKFNIADAVAADPSNVTIRLFWDGAQNGPNMNYIEYGWFVDDIRVVEAYAYDISHDRAFIGDAWNAWETTDIPTSQAGLLTVSSEVTNYGHQVPTNLGIELTVYDAGMTQLHQSTGGALVNPPLNLGVTDFIVYSSPFDLSTQATGTYNVRMVTTFTEGDEVPSNDTLWRTFNITDNFMSHVDYEQGFGFTDYFDGGNGITEGFQWGAPFEITNNVELHGLDVFLGPGSDVGEEFQVYIYEWPDLGADPVLVDGPFAFDVTSSMINQWGTINFYQQKYGTYSPITLFGGQVYVAMIDVYAGISMEYRANPSDYDFSGQLYWNGDSQWYWAGDEPWIALNFDQALSIEADNNVQDFNISQNYPNPFDNTSVIKYQLDEAATVSVQFTDLSGKVVKTINNGTQAAGSYQIEIDSDEFADGVYFYTFTINDVQVTKKMTVSKK